MLEFPKIIVRFEYSRPDETVASEVNLANNFIRVYIHLIWKTWDKLPLITDDVKNVAYRVMLSKAEALDCKVQAIGGVPDHVHVLLSLPPTQAICNVVKELKGASSRIVTIEFPDRFFKWQGTYGAVSVSPNGVRAVIKYIQNQADHHNRGDLRDSFETAEEFHDNRIDAMT